MTSLFRAAPCEVIADGRLCGRTDERPLVFDRFLGWICFSHRESRPPQPAQVQDESHA